jgi:hypothetical protein
MRTHDIVCEAEGWTYLVDGVRTASYPSWFMALNAARSSAERDALEGMSVTLRYQGSDGKMHPVQTKAATRTVAPALTQGRPPAPEKRGSERVNA